MNTVKEFLDKAGKFPAIRVFNRFQSSPLYLVFFAIICVFSSTNSHYIYIPHMWTLTFLVAFGLIFNPDTKPFLAPFFMLYYAIGSDAMYFVNNPSQNILGSIAPKDLLQMYIMAAVILSSLFFRLAISGKFRQLFKQKNHFIFGLLLFSAALLTNGLFSQSQNFENFLYGALAVVGLAVAYLAIRAVLLQTENTVEYLCYASFCLGYTVLAQFAVLCVKLYKAGHLFRLSASGSVIGILETWMYLPWGVSNMIGAVVIMSIPSAIYLACSRKHCVFYYISSFLFLLCAFITMGRTSMVIGALAFTAGVIICSFFNKNSFACHIVNIAGILTLGGVILLYFLRSGYVSNVLERILSFFRLNQDGGSRLKLWKLGISDFQAAPIFGYGLINPNGSAANDYSNMYHNIIVQVLASLGIFGILSFAVHIKELITATFKKVTKEKVTLFLTPAMILAASMFDNFFFYLNFQMIYVAFLAAIEFINDEINSQILTKE